MSTDTTERPTTAPDGGTAHGPYTAASTMEALRLVTMREIVERGRTKSFTISAIVTLLLLGAAIVLPQLFGGGDATWRIGTVGDGGEEILRVAESIGRDNLDEDRQLTVDVTAYDDEAAARAGLEADEVEFVLVDGERVLAQSAGGFAGQSDALSAVQQAAGVTQLDDELAGTGVSPETVASALGARPLPVSTLEGEVSAELQVARSIIAYGGMLLLYFAILSFGNWTLMGIAEEKASRVVEVLLSTVKPWHLLAGKIIGIGVLGIAQFAVTVGWALLLIRVTGALELPAIPVDSAVSLILWFTLGYATYSVAFATAGALVSRMEDAQSAAFPVSMVAVVGFLASFRVLDDPGGGFAQILTQVPFVSPFVVPIRVAYGEIAVWEQVLSTGITLAAIAGLVWVAARVYTGSLLHFGGRMKVGQAWRGGSR